MLLLLLLFFSIFFFFFTYGIFFPLLGFSLLRYSLLVTPLLCLVTPLNDMQLNYSETNERIFQNKHCVAASWEIKITTYSLKKNFNI